VARIDERTGACGFLVRKHDGERPLARPRRRWDDNFEIDLQEMSWRDMDCTDVA
jgi:hypothetical protein